MLFRHITPHWETYAAGVPISMGLLLKVNGCDGSLKTAIDRRRYHIQLLSLLPTHVSNFYHQQFDRSNQV
jgi:hypothetical protein